MAGYLPLLLLSLPPVLLPWPISRRFPLSSQHTYAHDSDFCALAVAIGAHWTSWLVAVSQALDRQLQPLHSALDHGTRLHHKFVYFNSAVIAGICAECSVTIAHSSNAQCSAGGVLAVTVACCLEAWR